jgi:CheY-like chemotaxis protein
VDATILLVEDDSSIREITKLGLEDAGFAVRTAVDGDEGLARFRREQPDLVVLDVMLPKRDGLEVCRSIRAESSVPVVMLTARSDAIDIVVGLESGADDYVTKRPQESAESRAIGDAHPWYGQDRRVGASGNHGRRGSRPHSDRVPVAPGARTPARTGVHS